MNQISIEDYILGRELENNTAVLVIQPIVLRLKTQGTRSEVEYSCLAAYEPRTKSMAVTRFEMEEGCSAARCALHAFTRLLSITRIPTEVCLSGLRKTEIKGIKAACKENYGCITKIAGDIPEEAVKALQTLLNIYGAVRGFDDALDRALEAYNDVEYIPGTSREYAARILQGWTEISEVYELEEKKKAKVQENYHVELHGKYYSVPAKHVGETLWAVEYGSTIWLVDCWGEILAKHQRCIIGQMYSTDLSHMPDPKDIPSGMPSGRKYWGWANHIGPNTVCLVNYLLRRGICEMQGYNSCQRLLLTLRKYPVKIAEEAVEAELKMMRIPGEMYIFHRLEQRCEKANAKKNGLLPIIRHRETGTERFIFNNSSRN